MPFADLYLKRAYQNRWVSRRRAEWIAQNGPCKRCGSTVDLDIDHVVPGSKDPKLAGCGTRAIWSWREERRTAELAKCQVLCGKCHVIKSMEAGERPVTKHGTGQMYQRHGCRCEQCRAYKRGDNASRKRAGTKAP